MKRGAISRSERGYVLLVLLLFVALLSIGFLATVRKLDFQVKRDREEELIHRGVQYSRAIKRFYKKFGRYPTRIEDLESTNNLRFLRKRYKDPMNRDKKTGKELDFKLLHLQDIQMSFNSPQAGMTSVQDMANRQAGSPGALNAGSGFGGNGPNSATGNQDQQTSQNDASAGTQNQQADQNNTSAGNQNPQTDPNDTSDSSQQVADQQQGNENGLRPQPLSQQAGPNGTPQVFGGGAIVGVASANKDKTIREFNKEKHYNQWQFIYNPTTDRGGLLMTPNQPPLQNTQNQQLNGQNGTNQNQGFSSSFGNGPNQNQGFSSGFGNGPNGSGNGTNPAPQPPQSQPDQQ